MFRKACVVAISAAAIGACGIAYARGGESAGGSHASSSGLENTNGPSSADRDQGLDRAEDRRSAQGAAREKADSRSKHETKVRRRKTYPPRRHAGAS